jgi:hypothetical protein
VTLFATPRACENPTTESFDAARDAKTPGTHIAASNAYRLRSVPVLNDRPLTLDAFQISGQNQRVCCHE